MPDQDRRRLDAAAVIRSERGGRVPPLFAMLLHAPAIAEAWVRLGTAVRGGGNLPARLRELVICMVARATGCAYQWRDHAPLAREAGVTDEQLGALPAWDAPAFDEPDRAILAYVAALAEADPVPRAVFDGAAAVLGVERTVEVTATAAYYLATSRLLVALDVDLDDG